ncbi:hypothetical protein FRB95_004242 [Tulasnella sp. JGI-2019a]|nr:hypothetical protein FRB93_011494 [Tulasnella sp. JGI-2019a]KAG9030193.1 hypothetical protein FRB95_004242 [Tulasnella sp. JGI-2019a]
MRLLVVKTLTLHLAHSHHAPAAGVADQVIAEPPATTPTSNNRVLFEGTCAAAWDGPSGTESSGLLFLTVDQFFDTHTGTPTSEVVFTFRQDGTSIGAFTVIQVSSPQRIDGVPTFPFRLQRIGDDLQDNVMIGMLDDVATVFCQVTGLELPPPLPLKEVIPSLPATSPLSQLPPYSPTASVPTPTPVTSTQANLLDPTRPITDHIYDIPCTRIVKGIHQQSSLHYRCVGIPAVGKMEWQVAFPLTSRNKKRDWLSVVSEKSHWQYETLKSGEPGFYAVFGSLRSVLFSS